MSDTTPRLPATGPVDPLASPATGPVARPADQSLPAPAAVPLPDLPAACSQLPETSLLKLWVILMAALFLGHLTRTTWLGQTSPIAAFLPALAMLLFIAGDVRGASGSLRPLACHDEAGRRRIIQLAWVGLLGVFSLLVPTFGPRDRSPGLTPEVFLGMAVLVPLAEEFFFRGALLGWLRARTDNLEAVLLTALCFAGLHAAGGDGGRFLATLGLGLGTGALAVWCRCLHPAIQLHAFYNIFQMTGGSSGPLLVAPFPILLFGVWGTLLLTAHLVRVRPHPED